jgi:hypothetical protein
MGWFGKKKIVDLSRGYESPAMKIPAKPAETEKSDQNFLSDMASSNSSSNELVWDSDNSQDYAKEKRIKLTKRLLDMTEKIEDLSNQIYHLKQRMEVIEKKLRIHFE